MGILNKDGSYETQFSMSGKITDRFEDGSIEMFGTITWEGMSRDNMYIRLNPDRKSDIEFYPDPVEYRRGLEND